MTLPELCIRRPVMTSLLMITFVTLGLFGYRLLPVAALPSVGPDYQRPSVTAPAAYRDLHAGYGHRGICGFRLRHRAGLL